MCVSACSTVNGNAGRVRLFSCVWLQCPACVDLLISWDAEWDKVVSGAFHAGRPASVWFYNNSQAVLKALKHRFVPCLLPCLLA